MMGERLQPTCGRVCVAFCVLSALIILFCAGGCGSSGKENAPDATVWTCSMHPQVRQNSPGRCPICGMNLTPVRAAESGKAGESAASPEAKTASDRVPDHAVVMIPGELQQRIGVRIGHVVRGPLKMRVNAVGVVQPDETRVARIGLKTEGWVDKLFVNYVGQKVRHGDPLLSIYSPQFLSTQQELLNAMRGERAIAGSQQALSVAARRRLELWDVPSDEIDELIRTGQPRKDLVLKSPLDGTVLEKNVFERQYVTPEKELYVIGDLSTVWVQAKVYEYEIPHVEIGRPATVTFSAWPDRQFQGEVVFIQPTVDDMTRTVQVRIELSNQEGLLKPGMFAQVSIEHPMGEGLLVPASAILRTGDRDIAYRAEPNDHFVPTAVKIGPIEFGDSYQILEGLKEGDAIAVSANFLIDSESRIRLGAGGTADADPETKE